VSGVHTLVLWPVTGQAPVRETWQGWAVIRLKCVDLLLPVVDEVRVEVRRGVRFRRGYVAKGPVGVANRLKWTDLLAGAE
jgi:hypothetical protein